MTTRYDVLRRSAKTGRWLKTKSFKTEDGLLRYLDTTIDDVRRVDVSETVTGDEVRVGDVVIRAANAASYRVLDVNRLSRPRAGTELVLGIDNVPHATVYVAPGERVIRTREYLRAEDYWPTR